MWEAAMVDAGLEYEAKLIEVELRAALLKVDPNYEWAGIGTGDAIPPVVLQGREVSIDLVYEDNRWTFVVCCDDLGPEECVFYQKRKRFAYSKIAKVLVRAAQTQPSPAVAKRVPRTGGEQEALLRSLGIVHVGACLNIQPAEDGRIELHINANMPVDQARELLATCHKLGMVRTAAEVRDEKLRWN